MNNDLLLLADSPGEESGSDATIPESPDDDDDDDEGGDVRGADFESYKGGHRHARVKASKAESDKVRPLKSTPRHTLKKE